jgi:hypothetical protein
MPESEENLKTEKYNREYLQLKISGERTSQQGRLYRYLKDQGAAGKSVSIKKAITAFYLVDALVETGTRSREDIQQIAQRCITDLAAQIARINQLTGLNYTLVSDNSQSPKSEKSKAKDDDDEDEEEDDEDEEEDDVFSQMMDEYGDDIEVGKMTEEQWKEWEKSM